MKCPVRPLVVAVRALRCAVCPRAYGQEVDSRGAAARRGSSRSRNRGDAAAYLALLSSGANRERAVRFLQLGAAPGRDRARWCRSAIARRCAARSPATATV